MDKALLERTVGTIVSNYPQIIPHLSGDVFAVLCKHYGPVHPGTGTEQEVHAGDGGVDGDSAGGDIEAGSDGRIVYRGEFYKLKDKVEKNGIKGKSFDGRPKSVYATTSEADAHLYGVQKTGSDMSYAVVAIRIPPGADFVPDERDTKPVYGRVNAIRIPGNVPADWVISVKEYKIPDTMEGRIEEDIAQFMYENKAAGARAYIVIIMEGGGDKKTLDELKTVDYFNATLTRMVRNVYTNNMGGEFVDILGALVRGQMRDAYNRAYAEAGFSDAPPDWLQADLEAMQAEQANFDYIYSYYQAIVDARVDGKPIQPLLDRVPMWVNRWREAHSRANMTITTQLGGRLMWKEGDTIEKCETCVGLDGIVAFASEWELSGFRPQGSNLICGGWQCQCTLEPTDRRRSPNAWDRIMAVASA